ncbi:hypothetical protein RJ639_014798 [Escallonia herrerae]|uniref:DUF4283 domain-containing protein n=1 Tax=Escallonia herrerae TaxID=1293975 RepID=A0AA89APK3_9ASTE|nr:hypothetical protein RJ639_014798 [Escallonia herrerae]
MDFPPLHPTSRPPSDLNRVVALTKVPFVDTEEEDIAVLESQLMNVNLRSANRRDESDNFARDESWLWVEVTPKEMHRLSNPWRKGLIVKLLGRSKGFKLFYQRMTILWKLKGELEAVDLGQEFYVVRFQSCEDYLRVLLEGPWIILGHYLTVQEWKPYFRPQQEEITSTLAWLRFPELLIEFFDE